MKKVVLFSTHDSRSSQQISLAASAISFVGLALLYVLIKSTPLGLLRPIGLLVFVSTLLALLESRISTRRSLSLFSRFETVWSARDPKWSDVNATTKGYVRITIAIAALFVFTVTLTVAPFISGFVTGDAQQGGGYVFGAVMSWIGIAAALLVPSYFSIAVALWGDETKSGREYIKLAAALDSSTVTMTASAGAGSVAVALAIISMDLPLQRETLIGAMVLPSSAVAFGALALLISHREQRQFPTASVAVFLCVVLLWLGVIMDQSASFLRAWMTSFFAFLLIVILGDPHLNQMAAAIAREVERGLKAGPHESIRRNAGERIIIGIGSCFLIPYGVSIVALTILRISSVSVAVQIFAVLENIRAGLRNVPENLWRSVYVLDFEPGLELVPFLSEKSVFSLGRYYIETRRNNEIASKASRFTVLVLLWAGLASLRVLSKSVAFVLFPIFYWLPWRPSEPNKVLTSIVPWWGMRLKEVISTIHTLKNSAFIIVPIGGAAWFLYGEMHRIYEVVVSSRLDNTPTWIAEVATLVIEELLRNRFALLGVVGPSISAITIWLAYKWGAELEVNATGVNSKCSHKIRKKFACIEIVAKIGRIMSVLSFALIAVWVGSNILDRRCYRLVPERAAVFINYIYGDYAPFKRNCT